MSILGGRPRFGFCGGTLPRKIEERCGKEKTTHLFRAKTSLGYSLCERSKPGSARLSLQSESRPKLVTFHEAHGKFRYETPTLREYIRKMELSKEQFLEDLNDC